MLVSPQSGAGARFRASGLGAGAGVRSRRFGLLLDPNGPQFGPAVPVLASVSFVGARGRVLAPGVGGVWWPWFLPLVLARGWGPVGSGRWGLACWARCGCWLCWLFSVGVSGFVSALVRNQFGRPRTPGFAYRPAPGGAWRESARCSRARWGPASTPCVRVPSLWMSVAGVGVGLAGARGAVTSHYRIVMWYGNVHRIWGLHVCYVLLARRGSMPTDFWP